MGYKNTDALRDEKSSQKAHSGGKGTLNCCFFVLISAQTGRFVQKNEGKKLHKNADVCMFLRWFEIFLSAFFCQFSLHVCSINWQSVSAAHPSRPPLCPPPTLSWPHNARGQALLQPFSSVGGISRPAPCPSGASGWHRAFPYTEKAATKEEIYRTARLKSDNKTRSGAL